MASALGDFVFITESAFFMLRDGFLTDGAWQGVESGALSLLRTPGGAQWWRYGRTYIGADIVAYLDKRLAEIDPSTPTFIDILPTYRKRLEELRALEAERGSPSPGS